MSKTYLAICEGRFENKFGIIEKPIKRECESIIKRIAADDGQYAKTEYEVMDYRDGYSLVKVFPKTGRTHQIRVHMAYIGHPLYGDFVYGTEIKGERTMLHCQAIEFSLTDNKRIKIVAPPPDDFFLK